MHQALHQKPRPFKVTYSDGTVMYRVILIILWFLLISLDFYWFLCNHAVATGNAHEAKGTTVPRSQESIGIDRNRYESCQEEVSALSMSQRQGRSGPLLQVLLLLGPLPLPARFPCQDPSIALFFKPTTNKGNVVRYLQYVYSFGSVGSTMFLQKAIYNRN